MRLAHNTAGPLGISVRSPILAGAREFVEAAEAAGIPRGDYNGRDRGGAAGVVSLFKPARGRASDRAPIAPFWKARRSDGRTSRSSPEHGCTRRALEAIRPDRSAANGHRVSQATGEIDVAHRGKEVILSAGAVGSPCTCCCFRDRPAARTRNASAFAASSIRRMLASI